MWLGICWRWRFTGQEQPEVKILPPGIMIEARSWHGRTGHSILFHSQERDHSSREERREGKTSLATEDKEATHRRRNNRMGGTTSQVAPRGVPLRALDSETIARWWVGSGKEEPVNLRERSWGISTCLFFRQRCSPAGDTRLLSTFLVASAAKLTFRKLSANKVAVGQDL
jgi:hypothetical protein